MKQLLLISTLLCWGQLLWAQSTPLYDFNQQRLERQQTGMLVLGSWAVVNLAGGLLLSQKTEGSEHYFHLMNAGWNGVNLAIAGLGYFTALKADPAQFDLYQSLQEQHQFQKVLLFNAGLDIAYVAGGFYLMERSKNATTKPERLHGFGRSLILQGGFLFAFDLANHLINRSYNKRLAPMLSILDGQEACLGFVLQF